MPFGCLTIREKKDYHNPSDVTDKYDMGQMEEFCEIFRAKDRTSMKMYTCKKFLKKDGRKVRKAAKNEILILKMVKHPNILQLVDVFETKKEYFLFLELATGRENVFDWILDQGYYSERDTSKWCARCWRPSPTCTLENLVYYNRLKHSKIVISDFHLAKLENGLIKDPCGTPEYLAPEVVGRQRYGRPVDCWATGVSSLSGNPPFYDETDDDDYENHDKNLFRKILAGDYEFDSPYWDEISDSAKTLVSRLMEVDQDQRLTAQEAISHEWYDLWWCSFKQNIKEHVCAQIEKNFARAKWKKAVRVTTIMKRLRVPEHSESRAANPGGVTTPDPAGVTPSDPAGVTPSDPAGVTPSDPAAPQATADPLRASLSRPTPAGGRAHAAFCNGEAFAPHSSTTMEEKDGDGQG
uniref:Protein kinase domain-containing protein n=1 Tax=Gouania willdenowi TaxID=441366 RepID=A0A8C5D6L8_GOUWI